MMRIRETNNARIDIGSHIPAGAEVSIMSWKGLSRGHRTPSSMSEDLEFKAEADRFWRRYVNLERLSGLL